MKIKIYKDKSGEWRFRIVARNGRILATGESYKRKSSVLKAIKSLKKLNPKTRVEEV